MPGEPLGRMTLFDEPTQVELADLALVLFDRPWAELQPGEQQRVKDRITAVRQRHRRQERRG